MRARFSVIKGKDTGKVFYVAEGKPIALGRSSAADISLSEPRISRIHCRFTHDGKHIMLMDLNSTNGTFVNERKIKSVPLADGDSVRIGETVITCHMEKEPEGAAGVAAKEAVRREKLEEPKVAPKPRPVREEREEPAPPQPRPERGPKRPAPPATEGVMGLFDKWLDEPQKRAGARPAPEAPARPGRERPAGERPVASGSLPSIAGVEMRKKTGDDSISEIYEGIHVFLARPVVVRILTGGARETSQHQDFVEWSKANARLVHPSILQVYDAGKVGDTYYAVSEMPEGAPLEAVMAREGKRKPLGVNLAIEIGIQLARALRRAHGEKVIHWDLRPSTVFISHERVARIGGFTSISHAARCAMNSGEMTSALPVHPYRAPELIHEVDIAGPSADIYGLSAVLYDMVCGRPPFVAESERGLIEAILRERPETPQKYNPTIPTEVCLVILKGLAKDPRNRHASAADLVRELKALQRMKSSGDEE